MLTELLKVEIGDDNLLLLCFEPKKKLYKLVIKTDKNIINGVLDEKTSFAISLAPVEFKKLLLGLLDALIRNEGS